MSILLPEYQAAKIKTRARDYIIDGEKYRSECQPSWASSTSRPSSAGPSASPWRKWTASCGTRIPTTDLATLFADPIQRARRLRRWVDRVIAQSKLASDEKRDEAANKGTSIHEEIRATLADPEDIALSPQARHAAQYLRDNGITLEATELTSLGFRQAKSPGPATGWAAIESEPASSATGKPAPARGPKWPSNWGPTLGC